MGDLMTTPEKIIRLREQRGWSQRELANRIGLDPSVMNRIEGGKRPIKDDELKKLSEILNVTADYLLDRSDKKHYDDFTDKDERDVAKRLEKVKKDLEDAEDGDGYMLLGEPISEEAKQSIIEAMEFAIRQSKRINKKYTPKKYRKE